MPRKQEGKLKIKGTLDAVLLVAFPPAKKAAKALPKKRGKSKKDGK